MKSARDNEMPQLNIFRRIKNVVEQIKCCFTLQIGGESGQNVLLMVFQTFQRLRWEWRGCEKAENYLSVHDDISATESKIYFLLRQL